MLICRYMCPESLHVYRRMGSREHERLINQASTMNVDAIQSANVVRVVGDQGYAASRMGGRPSCERDRR